MMGWSCGYDEADQFKDRRNCRININMDFREVGCKYYYSVQNLLSSRLILKNLEIKMYKTVILSVVVYGCETWSLTLREEHRLRVFENRVLRSIFGTKREEDGSWRKLHNELHSLYNSPHILG
jgi:hypothetical protein